MAALDNGSGIGVRIERAAGRSFFAMLGRSTGNDEGGRAFKKNNYCA